MEEKNIIGIILVVLSLVALCLQFITFPYVFSNYAVYRNSRNFAILSKLMMGFGMIVDFDFAGLPEQLIGGMLLSCWIMCVQQHLILAINRFAAIYQAEFYKSNWKEKVIFSVSLFFIAFCCLLFII
uniref:Uncharacterized protein n=1 Tax=Ditylenchus dipsaci TaxID=166011 RepID=A0A915E833_9BILA